MQVIGLWLGSLSLPTCVSRAMFRSIFSQFSVAHLCARWPRRMVALDRSLSGAHCAVSFPRRRCFTDPTRLRHSSCQRIPCSRDTLLCCQPPTGSRTAEVGLLQCLQHGPSRQFVPNNSRRTARALPVRPHVLRIIIVAQLWRLSTSIR